MTTPSSDISRVPLHDEEAERSLLGSLILEADANGLKIDAVQVFLRADHFYLTVNRRIYESLLTLRSRGEPAAPLFVERECQRTGILEAVGGKAYLAMLVESAASEANAEHFAEVIRDRWVARQALFLVEEVRRKAIQDVRGVDLVEELESGVIRLSEQYEPARIYGGRELAAELREEWETPPEGAPGVATGLLDLDALTGGLRPGQFVIVAGRPSMGKTTLALNMTRHAVIECGIPVLFVSLEVGRREVERNLAASISGVDTTRLHDPRRLRRSDLDVLEAAAARIAASPLRICDEGRMTVSALRAVIRREKLRHGVRMAVVDYLQLLSIEGLAGLGRNAVREQQVATLSRELKGLARDLEIPVVALCQLNRAAESRETHRPRLSDLRESGGLEADADLVMLMHREDYYASNASEREAKRGIAEIIVAKNRNGPTDTVRVAYIAQCARFGNLAREGADRSGEAS